MSELFQFWLEARVELVEEVPELVVFIVHGAALLPKLGIQEALSGAHPEVSLKEAWVAFVCVSNRDSLILDACFRTGLPRLKLLKSGTEGAGLKVLGGGASSCFKFPLTLIAKAVDLVTRRSLKSG